MHCKLCSENSWTSVLYLLFKSGDGMLSLFKLCLNIGFKGLKSHGRKRFPENEIGLRIGKDANRTSDEVKYPRNSEYK